MARKTAFTDPKTTIIFTYAPAGLGHLRVTDALRHGLPEEAEPILLSEDNDSIRWIHRLTSRNPLGKHLMEWAQYGWRENIVTRVYRRMLHSDARHLEREVLKVLKQRVELPKTLLVISTHFGLAHQLSVIKKEIERKAQVRVIIVMQVTDDSPQKIWYVPGIDLITVPSEQTREVLTRYGRSEHLPSSPIVVLPYPVSPHLSEKLLPMAFKHRKEQLDPRGSVPINVSIPVSGAAVGTFFAQTLMKEWHRIQKRVFFQVISKRSLYTDLFVSSLSRHSYIEVSSSHSDREIVELYEQSFDRVVVSFEVTKPSEQAFKAMFSPDQTGGVIMLFTSPVGRQEYDNLAFLERHGLIPTTLEQEELYQWSEQNWSLSPHEKKRLLASTDHWRGVRLPQDPIRSAHFIEWCHRQELFSAMFHAEVCSRGDILCREEVAGDGVKKFWKEVEKLLSLQMKHETIH